MNKVYGLLGGALLLLQGCVVNHNTDADQIELENRLLKIYGASGAAFTPDGGRVAVGTRDWIWVADTASLETIASLSYLQASRFGNKKSLVFVDNRRLIVGAQGSILIWDIDDHSIIDRHKLSVGFSSARAITWSEAQRTLAYSIGAGTGSIHLIEIDQNGFGPARSLQAVKGVPSDLEFSGDGRYLAAAADGEGVVILEIETGNVVARISTEGFVNDLELFGDNSLLVSGTNVAFSQFLGSESATELDNPDISGQVKGQIATRVAGGVILGTLTLFTAMIEAIGGGSGEATGSMAQATYAVASHPVNASQQPWCGRSTSISPDGAWLVDVYPGISREVIHVIEVNSGKLVKKLNPRGKYSCTVKFSLDGRQLLITTDEVARLYEVGSWKHRDFHLGN